MRIVLLVMVFLVTSIPSLFAADCTQKDICKMMKKMSHFSILDQCPNAGKHLAECKKVSEKPMEELPAPKFVDNKNGTVTDTVNKLIWLKSGIKGKFSLKMANEYALNSDEAGQEGWRIPTLPELRSLLQAQRHKNTKGDVSWIHPAFMDDGEYYYWTSTTCDDVSFIIDRYQKKICQKGDTAAWLINFKAGAVIWHWVKTEKYFIWLVREEK